MDPNQQLTQPTNLPQQVSAEMPIPKKSSPFGKIILIVVGVIVLLGVGGGAYYLGTLQNKNIPVDDMNLKDASQVVGQIPTPTPDPTVNWKTYSDTYISFKYPYTWSQKGDAGIMEFENSSTMQPEMGNGGGTIMVPQIYMDVAILNITSSAKDYVDGLFTSPAYTSEYKSTRKSITFAGRPAEAYKVSGEGSRGYDIAVSDGKGHLYIINIPFSYPTTDETFSKIFSSFKFTQ